MIRWMIVLLAIASPLSWAEKDLGYETPVSAATDAYIGFVQSMTSDRFIEGAGFKKQKTTIPHEGFDISFFYQRWEIDHDSVCSMYKLELLEYAKCTKSAKRMFRTACNDVKFENQPKWKARNLNRMFCNAAKHYKPFMASMKRSEGPTELQKAQTRCSTATVAAMNNRSPGVLAERDQACAEYRRMRDGK